MYNIKRASSRLSHVSFSFFIFLPMLVQRNSRDHRISDFFLLYSDVTLENVLSRNYCVSNSNLLAFYKTRFLLSKETWKMYISGIKTYTYSYFYFSIQWFNYILLTFNEKVRSKGRQLFKWFLKIRRIIEFCLLVYLFTYP